MIRLVWMLVSFWAWFLVLWVAWLVLVLWDGVCGCAVVLGFGRFSFAD